MIEVNDLTESLHTTTKKNKDDTIYTIVSLLCKIVMELRLLRADIARNNMRV